MRGLRVVEQDPERDGEAYGFVRIAARDRSPELTKSRICLRTAARSSRSVTGRSATSDGLTR
jgi:hypothetical protein